VKRLLLLFAVLFPLLGSFPLLAQEDPVVVQVTVVAGDGPNGIPADRAALDNPFGLAIDGQGNLYIAASGQHRVFRVDAATGRLTVVAGTGQSGYSGDGGPATEAALFAPQGLALDSAGNLFIADTSNHRVRRVDAVTGSISTWAGTGVGSYNGDSGPATSIMLLNPTGLAMDSSDNLYIADRFNNRIRKVDPRGGYLVTVAGTGNAQFSGDGGPATSAGIHWPAGIAVDAPGNLFISDTGNHRIRKVDATSGRIETIAGSGSYGYSGDDGPATSANLFHPWDVEVDGAGDIYIADTNNHAVRIVDATTGIIRSLAGNGIPGFTGDGGPASGALLSSPVAVAANASGDLYVADHDNRRIRRIAASSGMITTVGGNGTSSFCEEGAPASGACLKRPLRMTLDPAGFLYIADSSNHRIRKLDLAAGVLTTVAGNGFTGYAGEGFPATETSLDIPADVALDGFGNIYIADTGTNRIRKVDAATGTLVTVAGSGILGFSGDGGPAIAASLQLPSGVAADTAGNLFISDTLNNRIRRVDAETGIITTVAGTGLGSPSGDGGLATASAVVNPSGLALDGSGNLYVAEPWVGRIRRIDAITGIITTVAGGGSGDDGSPATGARLFLPADVDVDPAGNLFIAETQRVRFVNSETGVVSTLTGVSSGGGIALGARNAYVSETDRNRVLGILFNRRPTARASGPQDLECSSPVATPITLDASASTDPDGDPLEYSWTGPFPEGGGTVSGPTPTVTLPLGASELRLEVRDSFGLSAGADIQVSIGMRVEGLEAPLAGLAPLGAQVDLPEKSFRKGGVLPIKLRLKCGERALTSSEVAPPRLYALQQTSATPGQPPIISTVAGGGPDNIPALLANLDNPVAVASDSVGNLYIAVSGSHPTQLFQHRVFKVDPSGWLTVVAGNGFSYSAQGDGDGGPAKEALLSDPTCIAVDRWGNLFIGTGDRIRKVEGATGIISTVAGGGSDRSDGIPALQALLRPASLSVDDSGNLFIASESRVRRVEVGTGLITTAAGGGSETADRVPATSARMRPEGIFVDPSGNLFIADIESRRVRRVDSATGIITTIAGNGELGFTGDGGLATETALDGPTSVVVDASGNIYFTDTDLYTSVFTQSSSVRRVDALSGTISSYQPFVSHDLAFFYHSFPEIAPGPEGVIFLPEAGWGGRVHRLRPATGQRETVAGNGILGLTSGEGYSAAGASFLHLKQVAPDAAGHQYFLGGHDSRLWRVDAGSGLLRRFDIRGDAIAVDRRGQVYISSGNVVDRLEPAAGTLERVAGRGEAGFGGDGGPAVSALLRGPLLLTLDRQDNLYIADIGNQRIRRVEAGSRTISTVVDGTGGSLPVPTIHGYYFCRSSFAVDGAGDIYVADGYQIHKISASSATSQPLATDLGGSPYVDCVTHDGLVWIYFGTWLRGSVYRFNLVSGRTELVAGTGYGGTGSIGGDGGPAVEARLSGVMGLALDGAGNLFVIDNILSDRWRYGNNRIRKVSGLGSFIDLNAVDVTPGRSPHGDREFRYSEEDGTWHFNLSTGSLSPGNFLLTIELAEGVRYILAPPILLPSWERFFDAGFVLRDAGGTTIRAPADRPATGRRPDPPTTILRR
jgi:sugar lactone lactonase YvrE